MPEMNKEAAAKHKVPITTSTKRMAEDLTDCMWEARIRVKCPHLDADMLEWAGIIRNMYLNVLDVLAEINLLREGLDTSKITLAAILDADKEGLFRSETSLTQVMRRVVRNSEDHVIMYVDVITDPMKVAIDKTN